jgi:hypothetical protein
MKHHSTNVICNVIHSSDIFTVFEEDAVMLADRSDLGPRSESQIYADACDVGFGIASTRTGEYAFFYRDDTIRDSEGEEIYSDYLPITQSVRLFPRLAAWKVRVFND